MFSKILKNELIQKDWTKFNLERRVREGTAIPRMGTPPAPRPKITPQFTDRPSKKPNTNVHDLSGANSPYINSGKYTPNHGDQRTREGKRRRREYEANQQGYRVNPDGTWSKRPEPTIYR